MAHVAPLHHELDHLEICLDEVIHATAPKDVIRRMQILQAAIEHGKGPDFMKRAYIVKSGYLLIRDMNTCETIEALDKHLPNMVLLAQEEGTGEVETSRWTINKVASVYGAIKLDLILRSQLVEPLSDDDENQSQ